VGTGGWTRRCSCASMSTTWQNSREQVWVKWTLTRKTMSIHKSNIEEPT
jgi:hypothetical protein